MENIFLSELNSGLALAKKASISWNIYRNILDDTQRHYHVFCIPKKSGGLRIIMSPSKELDLVQRAIKTHILDKLPPHKAAFGFVRNKSIFFNAKKHMYSEKVLSIDIKDFFRNIHTGAIYTIFGKICKAPRLVTHDLVRFCSFNNGLPQGACTSPQLSNIASYSLDCDLSNLAESLGIVYTRYADDITFSGSQKIINKNLLIRVANLLKKHGHKLNQSKTRFGMIKNGVVITGLMVLSDRIIVPRKYVNKIKTELYYLQKYGIVNHKIHEEIWNRNYIQHIKGKILFVRYIESNLGESMMKDFENILQKYNFEIENDDSTIFDVIDDLKI
ncbi:MAG: reverse transcriptase domain-containing protein [Bacilli bacterium]|nr:reverse transcriptase domain-containing protein [Bacilli bacterium]